MATASNVSFDILLGGKVSPEAIKMLNDMEAKLQKFGASTRTINAAMSRSYKQLFDGVAAEGEKAFNKVEKDSKKSFGEMVKHAKEAGEKIKKSFEEMHKAGEKLWDLFKKPMEFIGLTSAIGIVGGAFGGGFKLAELAKRGIEVHARREEERDTLEAALRTRGRLDLLPGYEASIEAVSAQTRVSRDYAATKLARMAQSGAYAGPAQAQQRLLDLIGLGGGTEAGADKALAAARMATAGGRFNLRAAGRVGLGSGADVLRQMSHDLGMSVQDMQKAFGPKGGLGPAAGIAAFNKAIRELGATVGKAQIEAKMEGWDGLISRLSKGWDNFSDKLGEFWINVLSPVIRDIDQWLESINWKTTFKDLIERSKDFGNTLRVVFENIVNSPFAKQIQSLFDNIWKAMTGGVKMYEDKPTRVWKKITDAIEHPSQEYLRAHTKLVYRMTPEGKQWTEQTSKTIIDILNSIRWWIEFMVQNHDTIIKVSAALLVLFVAGTAAGLAVNILKFAGALVSIPKLAIEAATAIGITEGVGLVGALGLLGGVVGGIIWAVNNAVDSAKKHLIDADVQATRAATMTPQAISEADRLRAAIAEDEKLGPTHHEHYQALKKVIDGEHEAAKANNAASGAVEGLRKKIEGQSPGLTPAVEEATKQLNAFVPAMQAATTAMSQMQFGLGGGGGDGVSGAGGPIRAEAYGPSQGEYTHDTLFGPADNRLVQGDYAVSPDLAAGHSLFSRFQFTDAGGILHNARYADASYRTSGHPNTRTIEAWNGRDLGTVSNLKWLARGGVVSGRTGAMLGEAGPEMVLPLTGNLMSKMGHTVNLTFGNVSVGVGAERDGEAFIREFSESIAREVKRVIESENRRSAVV